MRVILRSLIGLWVCAFHAHSEVVTFTAADAAASSSAGAVSVGGTATQTTYTVSSLDLDSDGTNDPFTVQVNVSSSSGNITWSGAKYLHDGGNLTPGESITIEYGGITGGLSGGGELSVSNFVFDTCKMTAWQSANNEAYTITESGVIVSTNTSNTASLSDDNFTVTAFDNGGATSIALDYFGFTITLASASVPPPSTTANGKNLIWIITDEHNLRTLGCYRDTMTQEMAEMWGDGFVVETPHIDSIAANGALFTRMHASTPTCTPARGSMFSGIYPQNLGVQNNSNSVGDGKYLRADVVTVFDVLKDAGYMTGYSGKWHLGEHKAIEDSGGKWWEPYPEDDTNDTYGIIHNKYMFNAGHDKWYGIDSLGNPYLADKNPTYDRMDEWGQPVYADATSTNVKFATDWLTDRAIEFVEENKTNSFFYVLSIPDPHTADSVRAPYDSMYTNMAFELPRTWFNPNYDLVDPYTAVSNNPGWMEADGKAADLYDPTDTGAYTIQDKIAQYFGMVKCIDDNVGRLIAQLENEGVLEDTLILFTADHGDLFGEHRRVNKGTPQDTSLRIPFVLADGSQLLTTVTNTSPMVPRGMIVDQPGNTVDWMETFLSLLDVNSIPDTPGMDLSPLLDPENAADWQGVSVSRKGWVAACDSRYKLVVDFYNKATWLFDLELDPKEYTNYVDRAEYDGVVRKLGQSIRTYMAENNETDASAIQEVDRLLSGWTRYAEVYGLNPNQKGDADGDGLLDINEYLFGSDPTDSNSVFQIGIQVNATNGWATFCHRALAPQDPDFSCSAEWSTNLLTGPWYETFDANHALPTDPGFEEVSRSVEQGQDALYFRLRVEEP